MSMRDRHQVSVNLKIKISPSIYPIPSPGFTEIKCINYKSGTNITRRFKVDNVEEIVDTLLPTSSNALDAESEQDVFETFHRHISHYIPFIKKYEALVGSPCQIMFITQDGISQSTGSEVLETAFLECEQVGVACSWMSEGNCMTKIPVHDEVYVLDPLEGKCLKYLMDYKNQGTRINIFGPSCIRYYIETGNAHLYYSTLMRNFSMTGTVIVLSSRFSDRKTVKMTTNIREMNGTVATYFPLHTTHVIVPDMLDNLCPLAIGDKKPIMTEDWLYSLLNQMPEVLSCDDQMFQNHQCKVFTGIVFCLSQLDKHHREQQTQLIKNNGGTVCGELLNGVTDVLVLSASTGLKFQYAREWGIYIVTPEWTTASIAQGYPQPFVNFEPRLVSNVVSSAETIRLSRKGREFVDSSGDETTFSPEYDNAVDLKPSSELDPQPYVFCCTKLSPDEIHLVDILAEQCDGKRQDDYNESVTHLITNTQKGKEPCPTFKYVSALADNKTIISIEWVRQCHSKQRMVNEEDFKIWKIAGLTNQPKTKQIFHGIRFVFMDYDANMMGLLTVREWKSLIQKLGGTIINFKLTGEKEAEFFEYAVVHKVDSELRREKKAKFGFLTISVNWIVKCILSNKLLRIYS